MIEHQPRMAQKAERPSLRRLGPAGYSGDVSDPCPVATQSAEGHVSKDLKRTSLGGSENPEHHLLFQAFQKIGAQLI